MPAAISVTYHIRLNLFLLKGIEKITCAIAGMITIPITSDDNSAKVLVNASGLNSFPSASCMANTGRKLTMVVASAVIMAEATSVLALYITVRRFLPPAPLFSGISKCRTMFSVNTIPTSTITPMAMAIPERATILASTPNCRMVIKVISTPMGNRLEINRDARKLSTRMITTIMLMRISCESADSSVPRVSLMRPVRS